MSALLESENHADEALWERCKREANAATSGKSGVWTMADANRRYKAAGGKYKGKEGGDAKAMRSSAKSIKESLVIREGEELPEDLREGEVPAAFKAQQERMKAKSRKEGDDGDDAEDGDENDKPAFLKRKGAVKEGEELPEELRAR